MEELRGWDPWVKRLEGWRQTPDRAVADAPQAATLIDAAGIATVYPASSEIANLFHAHVGNPDAKTDSKWDSPSGRVYSWRWELGRMGAAFYGSVVRKRPTFVSWPLLPAVLRLVADLRTPDELYDFGVISADAYRIARVLDDAKDPVGTSDLRKAAGFPMGRERSAAYHHALAELDTRLLITNEFSSEEGIKHHGIMFSRHPDAVRSAEGLSMDEAARIFLEAYLPTAAYVVPSILARHLRAPGAVIGQAVRALESERRLEPSQLPGGGSCSVVGHAKA